MKKAFLEQMLLGFIAISGVIVFIATVIDENNAKNKYRQLEDLSLESIKALSSSYFTQMQGDLTSNSVQTEDAICAAQDIADGLLRASSLGSELIDQNKIQYVWRDAGVYDAVSDTYSGGTDGYPDIVTATISDYTIDNFWYKFLGKDNFNLPGFSRSVNINDFVVTVDVDFRGVINAGYFNMVGTYEIGDDGCPKNGNLILDNKKEWEDNIGETMAEIEIPKTKIFFIADGYRRFGNYNAGTQSNSTINTDTSITFDNPAGGCDENNPSSFPAVTMTPFGGSPESSADVISNGLTSRANVYFEDEYLNFDDQYLHMDEVAEESWGAFVAYMENSGHWNDEARAYANTLSSSEKTALENGTGDYDGWRAYVTAKGLTPDFSPSNQYVFISEDLSSTTNRNNADTSDDHDNWNSDQDFSDMSFSMFKQYKPEPVESQYITGSIINVTCP